MNSSQSKTFSCFCNRKIEYSILTNHIKTCKEYQAESPFFKEFQRLPMDKLLEVHLVAIHSEFNLYQEILAQHLKKFGFVPQQSPSVVPNELQQLQVQRNNSNNQGGGFRSSGNFENKNISSLGMSKLGFTGGVGRTSYIKCESCQKNFDENLDMEKMLLLERCFHWYCKICLSKQIQADYVNKFGDIPCKVMDCQQIILPQEIQNIIGKEKKEKMDAQMIAKMYNIITCVNCKEQHEFQAGAISDIKNEQGQSISKDAQAHYAENRFTCVCKTEQCKSCQATPYHVGYDCENYKKFQNAKHCRYCDAQMNKPNLKLHQNLQDICDQQECTEKAQMACEKVLGCGHNCGGIKGEGQCPPCLIGDCAQNNNELNGQCGDDYCNICFVEGLSSAPVVQVGCSHFFHYHCLKKRLDIRWPSARISFNFCLCPLCKEWMQLPQDSDINVQSTQYLAQVEDIKKKSLERLKHEERLKDEKLINPQSAYYQKPNDYAMAIYAYYECFKCKKSYFGGHKDCQQAMDEGSKDFKASELVCANCCDIPSENCPKHGKEFIEFKCKFCCSVAQWFCWGTTHFCDPCHKKQCAGDYVSKYPKDKLPKCGGKNSCPLKEDHKPNGEEFSLGCLMCKNARENANAHNF